MSLERKTQASDLVFSRFTAALERRVLDYVHKHRTFSHHERVLLGVSGGPDSTALLVILSRLRPKLGIEIAAGHFDHMLRTRREAEDDARFIADVAGALNVPVVSSAADVRADAGRVHRSLEDAARRLRYAFFAQEAASLGVSSVALGHTLDDQAETVLLHLIRGAGLDGLAGMRPRAHWPFGPGPDLARPLLGLRRTDTQRYCRELGIEPLTDPTNDLPIATRNRLRNELLPVLRRFNPRVVEAVARLADAAAGESGYVGDLARSYFPDVASTRSGAVFISRDGLLAAHQALARRLIRLAMEEVGGTAVDVESVHVETLVDALEKPPGSFSLPGGLTATTDQRSLIIQRGHLPAAEEIPERKLRVPGQTRAGGWTIFAEISGILPELDNLDNDEGCLDAARLGCELTVRSRRPGDRLRPLGLGGEKKLQDIFVDARVPARERDGIPLVCAGGQIAWVVGHCIDERFALALDTKEVLHLHASRLPIPEQG